MRRASNRNFANYRNRYLEESLSTRNDAIDQLRNQLKQRSALLDAYAEYEEEMRAASAAADGNRAAPPEMRDMRARLLALEAENTQLKDEVCKLKYLDKRKLFVEFVKREKAKKVFARDVFF